MPRHGRKSLTPIEGARRSIRSRLRLRDEFVLAFVPTATVLAVLALLEVLSTQRLLFSSLASSAFLIYLDPEHNTNNVRTLVVAQMMAASIGMLTYVGLGSGYFSGGVAMGITIALMILADAVHPPAVSTALSFAFRAENAGNLLLFSLAVAITAILVVVERVTLWLLGRFAEG